MDVEFSAEQEELRAAIRDLARDHATGTRRRAVFDEPTGYDAELWRLLSAELGLSALLVPEARGGAGGTFLDAAVLLEEAGRALLTAPVLPTLVATAAVEDDQLAALVTSGAALTVAVGALGAPLRHVPDAAAAAAVLLAAPDGLYAAPLGESAEVESSTALDPTRRLATITLPAADVRRVGDAVSSARALDLLRVALAVEMVGCMRWCVETTVDYLKTRVQFDRPIGSFQALQHRAADLVVQLEAAASTAYYAAWAAAASPDELAVLGPLALATCGEAAAKVAGETIQMHGGIGFTWEHDAHLYFKRVTTSRLLLGDSHEQRRLVAQRAGLSGGGVSGR